MMTILVANAKGGSGKSTLATNLAAAFAVTGHRVALADNDPQHSALGWLGRRPREAPAIEGLDWARGAEPPAKGTGVLVIDSRAGLKPALFEELARAVDRVVVPVIPSPFDESASASFLECAAAARPVRKGATTLAVVGMRVRAHTRAAQRLDGFLAQCGLEVLTRISDAQTYPEAVAQGLSLFDLQDRKARALKAEWQPLLAFAERPL